MAIETDVSIDSDGKRQVRHPDREIAVLAARQHGVVSRQQLLGAGLSVHAVERRLRVRRLHRVHQGVYAVGHPVLSRHGRWMAAVLAGGPQAVLSHRAAAALWGLLNASATETTSPRQTRTRPRITAYASELQADEVTTHHGIPTTTVARTLLDLATVVPKHQLERAAREAQAQRLTDMIPLPALADRHRGRRGTAAVRALLQSGNLDAGITRSELEEAFLAFLDAAHLSRPKLNAHVPTATGLVECDCVWPSRHLVVELDGHAFHAAPHAFERDRARDRALQTEGWRVIRVTWRHLHDAPQTLATDLRALLTPTTTPPRTRTAPAPPGTPA